MSDEPEIAVGIEADEAQISGATFVAARPDDSHLDPLAKILQMSLWSEDSSIVAAALKELADLCDGDNSDEKIYEMKTAVYEGCGGFAVTVVMKKWYNCLDVQVQGCRALGTCGSDASSFCAQAVKFGALSVVALAMRNFCANAAMQSNACLALRRLMEQVDWSAASAEFKTLNGPVLTIQAINNFPKDAQVQLHACELVRFLSNCYEGLPEAFVDEGALEALGVTVRSFKEKGNIEHEAIREHARSAIHQLLAATSG